MRPFLMASYATLVRTNVKDPPQPLGRTRFRDEGFSGVKWGLELR